MMTKFLAWTAVATLSLASVVGYSHNHKLCSGFVEDNNMNIPVGFHMMGVTGGIDEAQFNKVMDRIELLYTPIVKAAGGNLKVVRNWTDGTVNAYAQQTGANWEIQMFGGLARHPAITEDAMAVVACHEIGHHIGGAPKVANFWSTWASNEGQSDYFAGLKCLRLYYTEASNNEWIKANGATIPAYATDKCNLVWKQDNERITCLRTAMATYAVGVLFQDLREETVAPQFNTPDATKVVRMDDRHPGTQCRVDTYFNSGLCTKPVSEALSNSDYKAGTCAQVNGATEGFRPLCWFKP